MHVSYLSAQRLQVAGAASLLFLILSLLFLEKSEDLMVAEQGRLGLEYLHVAVAGSWNPK